MLAYSLALVCWQQWEKIQYPHRLRIPVWDIFWTSKESRRKLRCTWMLLIQACWDCAPHIRSQYVVHTTNN